MIANITIPIATSYSCVGCTATTVDGSVPGGNEIPNSRAITPAVDGGAPSGNCTASGPFHGRP